MSAYVDSTGVTYLTADIKALADAAYVNNVFYDSTNKIIKKTIGSTSTNVVTLATLESDLDLDDMFSVVISEEEPTNPHVNGWIDPTTVVSDAIPQIDDTQTSSTDTYSSSKINSTYLAFGVSQTLTEGQMTQLYTNMGFPSNTLGKLGYTVVT